MVRIIIAFTILTMACNDSGTKEETPVEDAEPAAIVASPDTPPVAGTPAQESHPYALTEEEKGDDSVFTDGSRPTTWANAGFDNPEAFKLFVKRLKYWVKTDQRDSVANVLAYPLRNPPVKNRQAFLTDYTTFLNDNVKNALYSQNLRQIFRRDTGAMIGNGEIWFRQTEKGQYRITGINYK